ncbi:SagB/ThcOx family dehydrogenase [uncultured Actinomyces sp.]|uniref:SagB/ThcOx family dehydrogenase n=1 Tax=uncultured Actinomyces sp. TaxID=249061 RepID=UPI00261DD6F6|nr:SagB/ThcOx family dehydrogenase [uncultured Actinomyces sp.]
MAMKISRRSKQWPPYEIPETPFLEGKGYNPWLLGSKSLMKMNPTDSAVGFQTNQYRYANRPLSDTTSLGEMFLAATRQNDYHTQEAASSAEYFTSQLAPVLAYSGTESVDSTAQVSLPPPEKLTEGLSSVINRRHTARSFADSQLDLTSVSTILYTANGVKGAVQASVLDDPSVEFTSFKRTTPSGGGLYGVDIYVLANNVTGLSRSAYKYLPFGHRLAHLRELPEGNDYEYIFMQTDFVGFDPHSAPVVLVLVGRPNKFVRKYGDRGIRFMLLEAGNMSYATNLAAIASGLGVLDYQSYDEDVISALLTKRVADQVVLHSLIVGTER